MEAGEAFAQSLSPATLCIGTSTEIPCKIGQIKFHEMLGPGGIRAVRSMHVAVRRIDVNPETQFTRGQKVTVKRLVRGATQREAIELEVGDDNGSDSVTIHLNLERPPV